MTEHEVLHELRQELIDYEEDLGEMREAAMTAGRQNLKQTKGAARLFKMVNTVLGRAGTVVKKLETRESKLRTDIDTLDKVGVNSDDQVYIHHHQSYFPLFHLSSCPIRLCSIIILHSSISTPSFLAYSF